MKFQRILGFAVLSACVGLVSAGPGTPAETASKLVEKSLETLIQELADPQFQTREEASRRIWEKGESALASLQTIAAGTDPEQAYRARELIRKIQLYLTPDTDPVVMALTESWEKASPDEKVTIFARLNAQRAWRQILKLYAAETRVDLQLRLLSPLRGGREEIDGIAGVAVKAAREKLAIGDTKSAREFLEMAPADPASLLALADFHRSQGTLEAELKRAKTLTGHHAAAWQLALYRAGGNLEQAKISATSAGELKLAALLSALLGDPLPWLQLAPADGEEANIKNSYTTLATRRWQGLAGGEPELELLQNSAQSQNRIERHNATCALFLLGKPADGEAVLLKKSAFDAFIYYESQERIPEALKALGLDPEKPDYPAWVGKRFQTLEEDLNEDDHLAFSQTQELLILANLLERRGLLSQCDEAFLKPLATLAESDAKAFTDLLGQFFTGLRQGRMVVAQAPGIAKKAAVAWAGEDDDRWDEVVIAAIGDAPETGGLLDWLAELKPKSSRAERYDGLLAVAGLGRDPLRLREQWLDLAWAAIEKTPADERQPLLGKMAALVNLNPDAATSLRLWDMLPAASREGLRGGAQLDNFSAVGRWQEVSELFLKQIEHRKKLGVEPEPSLHAFTAASLRKAGRGEQAAAQDALVDKLALGNGAARIAAGYSYGGDDLRAAEWQARAVRQCDPDDTVSLLDILQADQPRLFEAGKWQQVAAVSEVVAQMIAQVVAIDVPPRVALSLRFQSDLGRALANLKNDRASSIELLRKCHQFFPNDGSLADDFFPALRKAKLMKEHDAWFDESWAGISAVITQFPDSDNTCNTAAWLAARARRNLDQAEKLEERALASHPNQSAYLDTMAEIQFAKGNRRKSLEWSERAVNFTPSDPQLKRQNERFRNEPLPR